MLEYIWEELGHINYATMVFIDGVYPATPYLEPSHEHFHEKCS